jgi:hypothetical protein
VHGWQRRRLPSSNLQAAVARGQPHNSMSHVGGSCAVCVVC